MAELSDSVSLINGIGKTKALSLQRLGVFSLYDLISFFPRRYDDRSKFSPIALAADGDSVCIQAIVANDPRLVHIRSGCDLIKFRIADETGIADVTYFNQTYMKNMFHKGSEYVFYGQISVSGMQRSLINPICEKAGTHQEFTGKIVPVYRLTAGLSQKTLVRSMQAALSVCIDKIQDPLPQSVVSRQLLVDERFAYTNIHFPSDSQSLNSARKRLVFDELFTLAAALSLSRHNRDQKAGIQISDIDTEPFFSSLPFAPTDAQMNAIADAVSDMSSGKMMNRLVQGDVGSGKTLVAVALCYIVCKSGYTCAFMAPTEILAEQHLKTFQKYLSPFGITADLLSGSLTVKEKKILKERLRNGQIDVLIGTHALFSADTEFYKLALVITDEQHRFGVNQRAALAEKGLSPHILVMSATPIPRTLSLIIYGDLDVSVINELPPGRKPVETYTVDESYRKRVNNFILKQHALGKQTFIVCPKVEDNEEIISDIKSAEEHAAYLKSEFPELKIGCVHGRLNPKEKDSIMDSFSSGNIDVLVSTTVIEVGVDVPNATLMIIENAERFGLSQLHQLRGRVGRGDSESYCILISSVQDDTAKARLRILCQTNDGFKISEEDLRLRGPGDFLGSRQHGLPEMHIADLGADTNLLKIAQEEAKLVLEDDPQLIKAENRNLRSRIESIFSDNYNILN